MYYSTRPSVKVEEGLENEIIRERVFIEPETKKTLCEAIKTFSSFYGQNPADSPKLMIVNDRKGLFVLVFYKVLINTKPSGISLRLHLRENKQYKLRIAEDESFFHSIGFLIENNENLKGAFQYLLDIIECEKIVEKKFQEDTIIQEFMEKNKQSFGSDVPQLLIIRMVIIRKIVKKFFKKSKIKTKEQMDNLQQTMKVNRKKEENQTEKIKIEISVPTEEVSCKVVLYCEKVCFGVKFIKKIGTKKKEKTWRIFQDGVVTKDINGQKINKLSEFNQQMNKITGLNKKYGKTALEKKLEQSKKDQSDFNQEPKKTASLDQKKETLEKKLEQSKKDQSDFNQEPKKTTGLDQKKETLEKETK